MGGGLGGSPSNFSRPRQNRAPRYRRGAFPSRDRHQGRGETLQRIRDGVPGKGPSILEERRDVALAAQSPELPPVVVRGIGALKEDPLEGQHELGGDTIVAGREAIEADGFGRAPAKGLGVRGLSLTFQTPRPLGDPGRLPGSLGSPRPQASQGGGPGPGPVDRLLLPIGGPVLLLVVSPGGPPVRVPFPSPRPLPEARHVESSERAGLYLEGGGKVPSLKGSFELRESKPEQGCSKGCIGHES